MSKRAAIITGAARGLGLSVAKKLGNEGCSLHLLDLDEDLLTSTKEQLGGQYTGISCEAVDVRDQLACEHAVSNCIGVHGTLDILVNCAGVYPRVDIMNITANDWRFDFDTNVMGTYFMMVAACRAMKEQRQGFIVNVSSIDAFVAHPDNAHYAASKAAVVSLTRSFALAVAGDGVLVNSVAPGPMATDKAKVSDWYHDMVAELPTAYPIEPEEIADTVAFLVRPENRSLTGENIIVSGGSVIA